MTLQPDILLTVEEARQLTERIVSTVGHLAEVRWELAELIVRARDGGAWRVLGFDSWTAYLSDMFRDRPLQLSREERIKIAGVLGAAEVSTPAIAAITGTTRSTAWRDWQASEEANAVSQSETQGSVTYLDGRKRPRFRQAQGDSVTAQSTKRKGRPGPRRKHIVVLGSLIVGLEGFETGLQSFRSTSDFDASVTQGEAARVADDLTKQIQVLTRVRNLLREKATP